MRLQPIAMVLLSGFALASRGSPAAAQDQLTERVSVSTTGAEGNRASMESVISADGRFVAFRSDAENLVPGDTNASPDIFVYDRLTRAIERVSVASSGTQADSLSDTPSISADGRFVTFRSFADNLVANDLNRCTDVFVHDRLTGVTERASVDTMGVEGDDSSSASSISADGRFVAFESSADNLVVADNNGTYDVFVHDRATGLTERVSVDSAGAEGDYRSRMATISADGRFVAFSSLATNLVLSDANGLDDIFVHDRQTGATELVSIASSGVQADVSTLRSAISADGRFVAFATGADNLVAGDSNQRMDVFVRDRQTGTTERASVDSAGIEGNDGSSLIAGAISADGRYVAFFGGATNLAAGDTNGSWDVFVRDRQSGTTERISVDSSGTQGDGNSFDATVSADGRFVGFESLADDLVAGDANGTDDIFVHGPYLTLEADPPLAGTGATLTLTQWRGEPAAPSLLAIVDIGGLPMFVPALLEAFDGNGVWSYSGAVPSGLSGNVITLAGYGFVATGKVQASNRVAITFQ